MTALLYQSRGTHGTGESSARENRFHGTATSRAGRGTLLDVLSIGGSENGEVSRLKVEVNRLIYPSGAERFWEGQRV